VLRNALALFPVEASERRVELRVQLRELRLVPFGLCGVVRAELFDRGRLPFDRLGQRLDGREELLRSESDTPTLDHIAAILSIPFRGLQCTGRRTSLRSIPSRSIASCVPSSTTREVLSMCFGSRMRWRSKRL
jgi:hypothetical protein